MKLPTTTQKTSGFHICDILELNEEKKKSSSNKLNDNLSKNTEVHEKKETNELNKIKKEDSLSVENAEKINKRKFMESPSINDDKNNLATHQESSKKAKQDEDKTSQMFANTFQHYPHLFTNAVRPWLFNQHNGEFSIILLERSFYSPQTHHSHEMTQFKSILF